MADKTITIHDYPSSAHVEQLYHDNANGSFSPTVFIQNPSTDSVGLTDAELRATPLPVSSQVITPDADFTQVVTVTTAGTPVQGPNKTNPGGWLAIAAPGNAGANMWIFFYGQTKATKGYPISKTAPMLIRTENLSSFGFDTDTNGDKILFIKV